MRVRRGKVEGKKTEYKEAATNASERSEDLAFVRVAASTRVSGEYQRTHRAGRRAMERENERERK